MKVSKLFLILNIVLAPMKCNEVGSEKLALSGPKYVLPNWTYLHGHKGYYKQNLTGFPTETDFDEIFNIGIATMNSIPNPAEYKFLSLTLEPFLFTHRDENGFIVWGPNYALMREALANFNFRYFLY